MRHSKSATAACSVALLAALAACGGGGNTAAEPGNPTFSEGGRAGEAIDMTRSEGPAPDIEGAQRGGTVTVLSTNGLTTMDPTEAYYTNTTSILSGLVTRSLTQYVYDPETKEMVLIPDIATKWSSNDDYTRWTFTIRKGVRYENGDEVTCEDIAYGIKRSMDRATFAGGASYSNDFFRDGDKYKGPYKSGEDYDGVKCQGDELTILMDRPFPDMPYWGAFPAIGPIPPGDASDPTKYANHPLSTGPYMFDDYQPGVSLTLVKNPEWNPATDPGRHQYVDRWEMKFTEDTPKIDQIMLADTGSAQTTLTYDDIAAADFGKAMQESRDRVVLGSNPCTYLWFPDYRKITDIDVRKALGYAYPYEDAWKAAGEIVGVTRKGGTAIMPPGIPGRVEYDVLGNAGTESNPEKARRLLKQAGELGYEIKFLYVQGDQYSEAQKDQIVEGLEAAGFKPTPVAVGINQYYVVRDDPNADINLRSGGWCSDWPSGGSWFPALFASDGSNNYAYFEEKDIDRRIDKILRLPLDEQPAAWGQLDKSIQEKYLPVINIGYGGVAMMHGSRIVGMVNDNVFGMPTWKDIYVDS